MIVLLGPRERTASAVGAVGIVVVVFWLMLRGLPGPVLRDPAPSLREITLVMLPKPPPVKPTRPKRDHPRRAIPPGLRSRATPIVAPPPVLPPTPVLAALHPWRDAAAVAGVKSQAGSGGGAGDDGTGTGAGTGDEGGAADADGMPPRLRHGRISAADLPSDLRAVRFVVTVAVRYYVGADGQVRECSITRPSGYPQLDTLTCRLIEERFLYSPARDADGRSVASTIEEDHRWSSAGENPDPGTTPFR